MADMVNSKERQVSGLAHGHVAATVPAGCSMAAIAFIWASYLGDKTHSGYQLCDPTTMKAIAKRTPKAVWLKYEAMLTHAFSNGEEELLRKIDFGSMLPPKGEERITFLRKQKLDRCRQFSVVLARFVAQKALKNPVDCEQEVYDSIFDLDAYNASRKRKERVAAGHKLTKRAKIAADHSAVNVFFSNQTQPDNGLEKERQEKGSTTLLSC
jgi:hypothetical protein